MLGLDTREEAQLSRSLWCVLTTDVWEPKARYHTTHYWVMVVVPGRLWLASDSLHWSRVLSEASLGVVVAVLLASTVPTYRCFGLHTKV